MDKKRYTQIDICKGIGILLVVLGHALKQTGSANPVIQVLISVIYSFHMPMFFMLSGFVSLKILYLVNTKQRMAYIGQRAKRLLIPYAVMSLLYIPLKIWMSAYAMVPYTLGDTWRILIGDSPNTAVWFLFVLFFCSAAAALVVREENMNLVLAAAILFSAASYIMDWQIRIPRYFFYFLLGLWVRRYYDSWDEVLQDAKAVVGSVILFVLANIMGWLYGGLWFMLTAMTGSHLVLAFASWIDWKTDVLIRREQVHYDERISAAGTASSETIEKIRVSSRRGAGHSLCSQCGFFQRLGMYSMDIYILSEPIITAIRLLMWNVLHLPAAIVVIACFAGGLLLPIPVSDLIIRKVGILRAAVLGMDLRKPADSGKDA